MNGLIPKPEIKAPKWEGKLFYVSIISLIVTIAAYVGFGYYLNEASQLIQTKDIEIREIGTEEQKILAKDVLKYEIKIRDFSNLINKHQYATNFFKFLETSTIKGVVVTNMSLNILENKSTFTGAADNFQVLGKQENLFKNHEMLTKINLASASMDKDGKVSFNFELNINPMMFNKQNN